MGGDQLRDRPAGGAARCDDICSRCERRLASEGGRLPVCRRGLLAAAASSMVVGIASLLAGMTAAERLTTIRTLNGLLDYLQQREERLQQLEHLPPAEAPATRAPGRAP